jgi:hypothetical protein
VLVGGGGLAARGGGSRCPTKSSAGCRWIASPCRRCSGTATPACAVHWSVHLRPAGYWLCKTSGCLCATSTRRFHLLQWPGAPVLPCTCLQNAVSSSAPPSLPVRTSLERCAPRFPVRRMRAVCARSRCTGPLLSLAPQLFGVSQSLEPLISECTEHTALVSPNRWHQHICSLVSKTIEHSSSKKEKKCQ